MKVLRLDCKHSTPLWVLGAYLIDMFQVMIFSLFVLFLYVGIIVLIQYYNLRKVFIYLKYSCFYSIKYYDYGTVANKSPNYFKNMVTIQTEFYIIFFSIKLTIVFVLHIYILCSFNWNVNLIRNKWYDEAIRIFIMLYSVYKTMIKYVVLYLWRWLYARPTLTARHWLTMFTYFFKTKQKTVLSTLVFSCYCC